MSLSKDDAKVLTENFLLKFGIYELLDSLKIKTVFVAGSIFEGFSNGKSDIDIFIVVDKIEDSILTSLVKNLNFSMHKRPHKRIITTTFRDVDFDIEIHEFSSIENYAKLVNHGKGTDYDPYYDFFHRLKYAEPLVGFDFFKNLKKLVDYNKFNMLTPLGVQMYYSIMITDIQGAFEEKAYDTSLHMSLELLKACMSSYLSLMGETNPKEKWLVKKIRRFGKEHNANIQLGDSLRKAYENIDFSDIQSLKDKTIVVLKECQRINLECEKLIHSSKQ